MTDDRTSNGPSPAQPDFDVAIIGAGPAGLSLARALADTDLSILLLERQPRSVLQDPPFDGREIAVTKQSIATLRGFGAWDHIPQSDIAPLHEARVMNGPFKHSVRFHPPGQDADDLGCFLPNHQIRHSLFHAVEPCENVQLWDNCAATAIGSDADTAWLTLADGRRVTSRLIVAADTRFSEMRRRMGIPARMRDFGKTMMVCRMALEKPHDAVATEWFGYGQTIAILPLNGTEENPNIASVVITLPAVRIERLMAMEADAFSAEVTRRYENRLGAMRLIGTRHAYPLVGVYADRFVARRFALVGDAAVGMHPVTAHGFNLGLTGATTLAGLIKAAAVAGRDIGAASLLATYEARHRRATRPLYLATNATVLLYTDDRFPARVARDAILRAGEVLTPIRHAVSAKLMTASGPAGLPKLPARLPRPPVPRLPSPRPAMRRSGDAAAAE